MTDKQKRLEAVNQLLICIGSCGRRFFYSKQFANFEIDPRGRIWFIDDYTQKRIYTHYRYRWRDFSHGGTIRSLVERLRDYISKGAPVPAGIFGPWPRHLCNGDLWGYGGDMQLVRDKAVELGVTTICGIEP